MDILFWGGAFVISCIIPAYALTRLANSANEFYYYADLLEKEVRVHYDMEGQKEELFKLKEMSFHKNTGSRVREIAKMMEIKYNIDIIKK